MKQTKKTEKRNQDVKQSVRKNSLNILPSGISFIKR